MRNRFQRVVGVLLVASLVIESVPAGAVRNSWIIPRLTLANAGPFMSQALAQPTFDAPRDFDARQQAIRQRPRLPWGKLGISLGVGLFLTGGMVSGRPSISLPVFAVVALLHAAAIFGPWTYLSNIRERKGYAEYRSRLFFVFMLNMPLLVCGISLPIAFMIGVTASVFTPSARESKAAENSPPLFPEEIFQGPWRNFFDALESGRSAVGEDEVLRLSMHDLALFPRMYLRRIIDLSKMEPSSKSLLPDHGLEMDARDGIPSLTQMGIAVAVVPALGSDRRWYVIPSVYRILRIDHSPFTFRGQSLKVIWGQQLDRRMTALEPVVYDELHRTLYVNVDVILIGTSAALSADERHNKVNQHLERALRKAIPGGIVEGKFTPLDLSRASEDLNERVLVPRKQTAETARPAPDQSPALVALPTAAGLVVSGGSVVAGIWMTHLLHWTEQSDGIRYYTGIFLLYFVSRKLWESMSYTLAVQGRRGQMVGVIRYAPAAAVLLAVGMATFFKLFLFVGAGTIIGLLSGLLIPRPYQRMDDHAGQDPTVEAHPYASRPVTVEDSTRVLDYLQGNRFERESMLWYRTPRRLHMDLSMAHGKYAILGHWLSEQILPQSSAAASARFVVIPDSLLLRSDELPYAWTQWLPAEAVGGQDLGQPIVPLVVVRQSAIDRITRAKGEADPLMQDVFTHEWKHLDEPPLTPETTAPQRRAREKRAIIAALSTVWQHVFFRTAVHAHRYLPPHSNHFYLNAIQQFLVRMAQDADDAMIPTVVNQFSELILDDLERMRVENWLEEQDPTVEMHPSSVNGSHAVIGLKRSPSETVFPFFEAIRKARPLPQWTSNVRRQVSQDVVPQDEALLEKLGIHSGESVFAFAVYWADWAAELSRLGAQVTATDINPDIIDTLRTQRSADFAMEGRPIEDAIHTADLLEEPNAGLFDWSFSFEPAPLWLTSEWAWVIVQALLNRKGLIWVGRMKTVPMLVEPMREIYALYGLSTGDPSNDESGNLSIRDIPIKVNPRTPSDAPTETLTVVRAVTSDSARALASLDGLVLRMLQTLSGNTLQELQQSLSLAGHSIERDLLVGSLQRITQISSICQNSLVPIVHDVFRTVTWRDDSSPSLLLDRAA